MEQQLWYKVFFGEKKNEVLTSVTSGENNVLVFEVVYDGWVSTDLSIPTYFNTPVDLLRIRVTISKSIRLTLNVDFKDAKKKKK